MLVYQRVKPWKNQVSPEGIPLLIIRITSLDPFQAIGWNMFFLGGFEGIPKVRDLMDFDNFASRHMTDSYDMENVQE